MRRMLRSARLVMGLAVEADRARYVQMAVLAVFGPFGAFGVAVATALMVDAAVQEDVGRALVAASIAAVSLGFVIGFAVAGIGLTVRVQQGMTRVLDRRIMEMTTSVEQLEHLERPDYLDRILTLRSESYALLQAIQLPFLLATMVLQVAAGVVLLATVQILFVLVVPLAVAATWLASRGSAEVTRAHAAVAERRRLTKHLFSLATGPDSAQEVRIFDVGSELRGRHAAVGESMLRTLDTARIRSGLLTLSGWAVLAAGFAAGLIWATGAARSGELSPGATALAITMTVALIFVTAPAADSMAMATHAARLADHYRWLESFSQAEEEPGPQRPAPRRITRGFELRDVSFAYEGSQPVLRGLDLELPAGRIVALVGDNGAGKSTLVKLLTRMYQPTTGSILLDGTDLRDLDVDDYRRRISAGFQDFMNFELRVRETAGIGDVPQLDDAAAVEEALSRAGATSFVSTLGRGPETQLGASWPGGVDLSGGQWQKLAIARALMRTDPLLAVFDEPTAALDAQSESALFERLAHESARGRETGRITVLVSHRFSTVRMADLIVVLEDGAVLEQGSHDELMRRHGRYAELFELQASSYR